MINLDGVGRNKELFHEWIMACCDTFFRNEDKLYNLLQDKTIGFDVTFPIRAGEIAEMIIEINKIVQNNEEKIVVIKNLEDKENK